MRLYSGPFEVSILSEREIANTFILVMSHFCLARQTCAFTKVYPFVCSYRSTSTTCLLGLYGSIGLGSWSIKRRVRSGQKVFNDETHLHPCEWGMGPSPNRVAKERPECRVAEEGPECRVAEEGPECRVAEGRPECRVAEERPKCRVAEEIPECRAAEEGPECRMAEGPACGRHFSLRVSCFY